MKTNSLTFKVLPREETTLKAEADRIIMNRQILIDMSYNTLFSLVKLKEDQGKYGHNIIFRLNNLILETTNEIMKNPDNKIKSDLSKRLVFISEVRDLLANLVK